MVRVSGNDKQTYRELIFSPHNSSVLLKPSKPAFPVELSLFWCFLSPCEDVGRLCGRNGDSMLYSFQL